MNISKLVRSLVITAATLVAFTVVTVSPVSAQQTTCPEGQIVVTTYGTTSCLPKTPFAIGSVIIDDATMAAIVIGFGAVFAVVVNALIVKGKLNLATSA